MEPDAPGGSGNSETRPPLQQAGTAAATDLGSVLASARATIAQLRPGHVSVETLVPPQLLHPASAVELYGPLLGAHIWPWTAAMPRALGRSLGAHAGTAAAPRQHAMRGGCSCAARVSAAPD